MANDYFEQQFTGQSHGQANVDSVIASLERVEGGFDKIPTLEQLWTDSVTSAIATAVGTNYRVTLPYSDRLTAYVDQMRIGVRMPTANDGGANLDVVGSGGIGLGFIPMRLLDGTPLEPSHWAPGADVLLQFNATAVPQRWTVMAGGRGTPGNPSAPDGTFSINNSKELVFTATGGGVINNLGRVAPLYQGDYSAATEYVFLDVVKSGLLLYIHFGVSATTGTAVTDTTVWQPVVGGLAAVATSGDYTDLDNRPTLATVATSGVYSDLSGRPTLGTMAALNHTVLTQAQFDALTPTAGRVYFVGV